MEVESQGLAILARTTLPQHHGQAGSHLSSSPSRTDIVRYHCMDTVSVWLLSAVMHIYLALHVAVPVFPYHASVRCSSGCDGDLV